MVEGIVYAKAAACIAAGLAAGIGVLGPSFGQGAIGMKACENLGKYPESASKIRTLMFLAMGVIETQGLIVAGTAAALIYLAATMT
jgi:F-type H+-transporting ATPase subunit c